MRHSRIGLLLALLLAASLPIAAHHSGAMFDDKASVTLSGTVKEFQWTNPHCWIQVLVPDARGGGESAEWSVEMGAPFELFRSGLRPRTLKAGDRITVVVHPMRDGTRAGLFVSATGPEGKPLGAASKP
jgi:Family of unknown function (DUF6152)